MSTALSTALEARVSSVIADSISFIERNGSNTFDPLDAAGSPLVQRLMLPGTRANSFIRRALWSGLIAAPRGFRQLMRINPKGTASGVANLASLYIEMGGEEKLGKARQCLQWLQHNATRTPKYIGWGFPFSWKQALVIPAGTPIGHTTMTCANAFLLYHQVTGEKEPLAWVRNACDLFHYGLRKTCRSSGSVALSYTPLDQTQVINVQADISSLLFRFWKLTDENRDRQLAIALLECVLETQNSDGSWCYYAPDAIGRPSEIDSHHTGMVLSSLSEIILSASAGEEFADRASDALKRGLDYFLRNLFTADGLPKYYHNSVYPLDVYNFAQSIITLLDVLPVVSDDHDLILRSEQRLNQVIERLLKCMAVKDGGFLWRRSPLLKQRLDSLRWANALTTTALIRWRKSRTLNVDGHQRFILQSA